MNDVGKTIRQLRENKGLTQEQLADRIDVSIRTIQRFERDKHSSNMRTLEKIAVALDVSVNKIMGTPTTLPLSSNILHFMRKKEISPLELSNKTGIDLDRINDILSDSPQKPLSEKEAYSISAALDEPWSVLDSLMVVCDNEDYYTKKFKWENPSSEYVVKIADERDRYKAALDSIREILNNIEDSKE